MITFEDVKPLLILLMILCACGQGEPASNERPLSREPVSVRGWIASVEGSVGGDFKTVETEAARRLELFRGSNVYVENAPYVSGAIAETGAFMLLDVPPGDSTITFQTPEIESVKLELKNIPGNADVVIPGLILNRSGATLAEPEKVFVRIAAPVKTPRKTSRTAMVAGQTVPIIETPLNDMSDRRDYPNAPGTAPAPVATVK